MHVDSTFAIRNNGGQPISSVSGWFSYAPPKGGDSQWGPGKSATELARAWFPVDGDPVVPCGLTALLDSSEVLEKVVLTEGCAECEIDLDGSCGGKRNADLILLGNEGDGSVLISIEAKTDEAFGKPIGRKLSMSAAKSKLPERVDLLCRAVFGMASCDMPSLGGLRFQLLHGIASTIIEAGKRDARKAVFVAHEFVPTEISPESSDKRARNHRDYEEFIRALTGSDHEVKDGMLVGPITLQGGPNVPSDIPLYLGMIIQSIE